jgi:hypothetical protein
MWAELLWNLPDTTGSTLLACSDGAWVPACWLLSIVFSLFATPLQTTLLLTWCHGANVNTVPTQVDT